MTFSGWDTAVSRNLPTVQPALSEEHHDMAHQLSMTRPTVLQRLYVLLLILCSAQVAAMLEATPEQMMCIPAAFVIGTVTPDSPAIQLSKRCKGKEGCDIDWSVTIRIDQTLATRPSDLTADELLTLHRGNRIPVKLHVISAPYFHELMPSANPSAILTPMLPDEAITNLVRNHQFIFGLHVPTYGGPAPAVVSSNPSQIWAMTDQGSIERNLLGAANNNQSGDADKCATLDEQKDLQDAVTAQPSSVAALLAQASFLERTSLGDDEIKLHANELYKKAAELDQSTAALDGFMRTLGAEDTNWTANGLELAYAVLERDPNNETARRLLHQSYIHEGQLRLIDTADLSHSEFDVLDLSNRHLPRMNLSASKIAHLQAYDTDLSNADLRNVRIKTSGFWHAYLRNARMDGADLGNASITDTDLTGITGLKTLSSTNASGASFDGADLKDAELRILQGGIFFPMASFYGGWLDFEDDQTKPRVDLSQVIHFKHANLRNATIRITGLRIDLSGADLTGAKFELSDLRGADLSGAKVDGIKFMGTVYDCATKWPDNFSPAAAKLIPLPGPSTCARQLPLVYDSLPFDPFVRLNFANLDLRNATFKHSVTRARFAGADLSGADLRDADLRDAILENAKLHDTLYNDTTQWPAGFNPRMAGAKHCAPDARLSCH